MNIKNQKQLFAIFILSMFVISSIAMAILSAVEIPEKKITLFYDKPLANSEEAPYLQKNYVIVKYFYTDDCLACEDAFKELQNVFQDLNGKFVIESINILDYKEEAESLGVTDVPAMYFKGNTIHFIDKNITYDSIISSICSLYFEPIEECELV